MQNDPSEEWCKLSDKIMTLYICNGDPCNKSVILQTSISIYQKCGGWFSVGSYALENSVPIKICHIFILPKVAETVTVWDMMLTTHLHLMQQLRMTKATPLLPLHMYICIVKSWFCKSRLFKVLLNRSWCVVVKIISMLNWWSGYDTQTVTRYCHNFNHFKYFVEL